MAQIWRVTGLGLLLLLLASPAAIRAEGPEDDEYGDSDEKAFLVIRKSVGQELAVQGRNVTVSIDIYNAGSSSAGDVQLTDTLPEEASLLEGSLTASFHRISVGSHSKVSYVMVFNQGKLGTQLPAAKVTYRPDAESSEEQTGLSSVAELHVLTPVQQITRYAIIAGRYVSLGMAQTPTDWRNAAIAVAVIGSLLGGNYGYRAYTVGQTSRKRVRALRELEN